MCLSHAKYLSTNVLPYSETRQRGRFAGFSLYILDTDVSKTDDIQKTKLCYKDGPLLPPLNFTTICKAYGRYVIFYNERKQVGGDYPYGYEVTNVFTELCEVIVQGNISKIHLSDLLKNSTNIKCRIDMLHKWYIRLSICFWIYM